MNDRQKLGQRGEDLAVRYLERSGYRIVARNQRYGRFELDILARHAGRLILIEVKTRHSQISDDEPLGERQLDHLRCGLSAYCHENSISPEMTRCDLISISVDLKTARVSLRHYRDIFH